MLENMKFHLFSLRMSTTSTKTCWVNGWTGLSESFSNFNHSRILKETLKIIFLTATECQTCTQRGRHPKCCISFGFYTKKSPGKDSRRDLSVSSGESWAVLNDVQFHCNVSVEMKGLFQPQWFHEAVIQSPDKVHFSPGDWELWGEIQWHGRAFRSFKQKFLMWSQFVVEHFSLIVVVLVTSWLTKCSLKFQLCKKKKWFKKNCGCWGSSSGFSRPTRAELKMKFASFRACSFKPFTNPSGEQGTICISSLSPLFSDSKSSLWIPIPLS